MNNIITLPRLSELLSEATGIDAASCQAFVSDMTALITETLKTDGTVKIKGVGTFSKVGRDGSINVMFVPDKDVAEAINAPFRCFEAVELSEEVSEEELDAVSYITDNYDINLPDPDSDLSDQEWSEPLKEPLTPPVQPSAPEWSTAPEESATTDEPAAPEEPAMPEEQTEPFDTETEITFADNEPSEPISFAELFADETEGDELFDTPAPPVTQEETEEHAPKEPKPELAQPPVMTLDSFATDDGPSITTYPPEPVSDTALSGEPDAFGAASIPEQQPFFVPIRNDENKPSPVANLKKKIQWFPVSVCFAVGILIGLALGYFGHDFIQGKTSKTIDITTKDFEPTKETKEVLEEDLDLSGATEGMVDATPLTDIEATEEALPEDTEKAAEEQSEAQTAEQAAPTKETKPEVKPETPKPAETKPAKEQQKKETPKTEYGSIPPGGALSSLARQHYGYSEYWVYIYLANTDKIKNPNTVSPDIKLVLPAKSTFEVSKTDQKANIAAAKKKASEIMSKFR